MKKQMKLFYEAPSTEVFSMAEGNVICASIVGGNHENDPRWNGFGDEEELI